MGSHHSCFFPAYNLSFVGRHHSGLDDCKTIAQIVKILLQLRKIFFDIFVLNSSNSLTTTLLPDPNTFTHPKAVSADYDPNKDNSWVSFMGNCPPDAWLCPDSECAVYNKPTSRECRFCHAAKID